MTPTEALLTAEATFDFLIGALVAVAMDPSTPASQSQAQQQMIDFVVPLLQSSSGVVEAARIKLEEHDDNISQQLLLIANHEDRIAALEAGRG